VEAALRELVECKNLKTRIEAAGMPNDWYKPATLIRWREDYARRKPLAWETARRLLETGTPVTAEEG